MARALILLLSAVLTCAAQSGLEGIWSGTLGEGAAAVQVVCSFDKSRTTITSFATGAENKIESIKVTGDSVRFEVKILDATFEGKLRPDGKQIEGIWTQPNRKLPLLIAQTDKHFLETPELQGPVVSVPKPPTAVRAGGKYWLFYEVHITDWSNVEIALLRLDLLIGDSVLPIEGEHLKTLIAPSGTKLMPMGRKIVMVAAAGDGFPDSVRHRVTYQFDGETQPRTVDCAEIPVLGGPIRIPPPLTGGPWQAGNGPDSSLHHRGAIPGYQGRAVISQRFAFDFTVTDSADSTDNRKHLAYGAPVLAVADSTVLSTVDGVPDNLTGDLVPGAPLPVEKMFGNRVILDLGNSRYATYGHLQTGVHVKAGDKVHTGQVLGFVGNSGRSSGPHLHFQITDGPDPISSEGLPFVFTSFTHDGATVTDEMPLNDWTLAFPSVIQQEISRLFNGFMKDSVDPKDVERVLDTYGIPTAVTAGQDAANDFLFLLAMADGRQLTRKALQLYEKADAKGVVFLRVRLERKIAEARASKTPSNPELRDQLESLYKVDQAVRENGQLDAKMTATDAAHAPQLQAILDRYGVPTFDMVGRDAASHFVIMVQHQSPAMRRQALPLLKANVDKQQANASDYASEYDRSQTDQGKLQRYGENYICDPQGQMSPAPIEDPDHVDERRAEVGLEPLSTHTRLLRHIYEGAAICKK